MTSTVDAWQSILTHLPQWLVESVPISDAVGSVLRQAVVSDRDQPPFDRVTMDGIACNHDAISQGITEFQIQGTQSAGVPAVHLASAGHCWEVMTGAVLPQGCDCVIPIERIETNNGFAKLEAGYQPSHGQFIHRSGSDYPIGQLLIEPGRCLSGPDIAVLASVGFGEVEVSRRPSISVISTGDELIRPGNPVASHQIRMANDYAIAAGLKANGFTEVEQHHLQDNLSQIKLSLETILLQSDVLILSGGVSKGKFDYLPQALDDLGVEKIFHRVQQRPGKPMWFGISANKVPVFALPGNPVSALVCFYRYVLPTLKIAVGIDWKPNQVVLDTDLCFTDGLAHFVPVNVTACPDLPGRMLARPKELNTSGDFFGLSGTQGFIELDQSLQHCPAGLVLPFYPW